MTQDTNTNTASGAADFTDAQYLEQMADHYATSPVPEIRAHQKRLRAIAAALASAPAKVSYEKDLEGALRERDDADDFIDTLLDEVLGTERAEWSSAYGRANALDEVRERITALHKPAVDRAWARFEAPTAQPAPAETMTLQEVWNAAGGNPGIKPTRDDVLLALKTLDEVCDEVGRAKAPAPTPQADNQPAADEIINMAREQGLPETETEGVFIVNADDLGRIFASYRAARAPAERLPVNWMAEVERVICRMNSSDPDFDDCADAVALIIRLTAEVTGPKGYATWKDAAVAERIRANRVLEDAARYRWLAKEHGGLLLRHFPAMRPYIDASEVIDEAIDAARKQGASHESST